MSFIISSCIGNCYPSWYFCVYVCVYMGEEGRRRKHACAQVLPTEKHYPNKITVTCHLEITNLLIFMRKVCLHPSGIYSTCDGRYCTSIFSCKAATSCHPLLGLVYLSILTHSWWEGNPTLIWRASFLQNWFHGSLLTQWKKHIHIYSWCIKLENATFDFDFFFHFNKKSK